MGASRVYFSNIFHPGASSPAGLGRMAGAGAVALSAPILVSAAAPRPAGWLERTAGADAAALSAHGPESAAAHLRRPAVLGGCNPITSIPGRSTRGEATANSSVVPDPGARDAAASAIVPKLVLLLETVLQIHKPPCMSISTHCHSCGFVAALAISEIVKEL